MPFMKPCWLTCACTCKASPTVRKRVVGSRLASWTRCLTYAKTPPALTLVLCITVSLHLLRLRAAFCVCDLELKVRMLVEPTLLSP